MIGRLYVDTSALLCILLGEAGHAGLLDALGENELLSSTLLALEAQRNLIHCGRIGRLKADEVHAYLSRLQSYLARFQLRAVTLDLCLDPALPPVATPRSLDLIHLRTALWFHREKPLRGYVTMDKAQRQAAVEMGIPLG